MTEEKTTEEKLSCLHKYEEFITRYTTGMHINKKTRLEFGKTW